MKHIIYQNFCACRSACWIDYTILGLIKSELYYFGIEYNKLFCIAFIGREQTIYHSMNEEFLAI